MTYAWWVDQLGHVLPDEAPADSFAQRNSQNEQEIPHSRWRKASISLFARDKTCDMLDAELFKRHSAELRHQMKAHNSFVGDICRWAKGWANRHEPLLEKGGHVLAPRRWWGSIGDVIDKPANSLFHLLLRVSIDDFAAVVGGRFTEVD